LAALKGPQPASSSSRGAIVWVRAWSSRSSSTIERVSARQRPSSSREIWTWVVCSPRAPPESLEPDAAVERAERHPQRGVELVQVPAQPLLTAPPLRDQVVPVIDEQLHLAQERLLRAGPVEAGLAQSGAGDRQGVDRVGLAPAAPPTTLRSRQPWRHAHQALARLKQRLLETPGDVPAVLNRPQQRVVTERPCPRQQLVVQRASVSTSIYLTVRGRPSRSVPRRRMPTACSG
jgi:hypothetical protein